MHADECCDSSFILPEKVLNDLEEEAAVLVRMRHPNIGEGPGPGRAIGGGVPSRRASMLQAPSGLPRAVMPGEASSTENHCRWM